MHHNWRLPEEISPPIDFVVGVRVSDGSQHVYTEPCAFPNVQRVGYTVLISMAAETWQLKRRDLLAGILDVHFLTCTLSSSILRCKRQVMQPKYRRSASD